MDYQILNANGLKYNKSKFDKISNNIFLDQEWNIITKMRRGVEYYKYIIDNIELTSNDNNSYIMWIADKVNDLDPDQPTKFNSGNTAMPDLDLDFPQRSRGPVIEYIKNKYGHDKVCKIATYTTMMGRSALSSVFRATTNIGFKELKAITKTIKDKAAISDELQEMVDAGKKKSVILWGLENESSKLKDYCELVDGKLVGDYAAQFEMAIELEETKSALSEHAAGVVISRNPLRDCCAMVKNHDYLICGTEMEELERTQLQKIDLLGVAALDRLEDI